MNKAIYFYMNITDWSMIVKYLVGTKPKYKTIINYRNSATGQLEMTKAEAILFSQFLSDTIERAYENKEYCNAVQLNGISEVINNYIRGYLDGYSKD